MYFFSYLLNGNIICSIFKFFLYFISIILVFLSFLAYFISSLLLIKLLL